MNEIGYGSELIGNGVINIIASGGTPPYTYSLNLGAPRTMPQANGYFPGLNEASYNAVVTDAIGVTVDTTIVLTNTIPQVWGVSTLNQTYPKSCTDSSGGSLTLTANGGTLPYTWSINGGVSFTTNNVFTGLSQGEYGIYVKDANGCMAFYDIDNIQTYNGLSCFGCCGGLEAVAHDGVSCTNEGSSAVYAFGGTPPYYYSLDNVHYTFINNSLVQNTGFPYGYIYNNLAAGLYRFYVADAAGDTVVTTFVISQSCYVAITYVAVNPSCGKTNGTLAINANYGIPPYTYTLDGQHFQNSNLFTGLAAGGYSVTVDDASGESYSIEASVYDSCPMISAVSTADSCNQQKGSIHASGTGGTPPYQYTLNGGSFGTDSLFTGLLSGIYTVTIKDANGFTATTTVTVANNCLRLSLTCINPRCGLSNGSITALASNGTAPFQYSLNGQSFQSADTFYTLGPGNFLLAVKDANGLIASIDTTLSNIPPPQFSVNTTAASCIDTGGSITVIVQSGSPPYLYADNFNTLFQPDSLFKGLDSAQYVVLVKDANGCISQDSVYLIALPTPTVSLGDDTVLCAGNILTLSVPQIPGYTYSWPDNSHGYTYAVTNTGTYSVHVINTTGCTSLASIYTRYRTQPQINLGEDTVICSGQTLLLQPVLPQASWLWSTGSTASTLLVDSPGIYWLQVSDSGCTKTDSIQIGFKPAPSVLFVRDTTLCTGQVLLINAANPNSTYQWQDGSTQPTFIVDSAGTYSVIVDENGCVATAQATVSYISKPVIQMVQDTALCITQQLLLDASYPNSTYSWQDGSTQAGYTVTKAGLYTVQVTNICGSSTDSTTVSFENCTCKFFVPNAFTPNHDGNNDLFMPKYQCLFSNYQLKIYNRWGQLVFVSQNVSEGWDGNYKGQQQPTGTYVWVLSYLDDLTGKSMQKNGTVVLIR
jgi:gliding motility-associated-like protein